MESSYEIEPTFPISGQNPEDWTRIIVESAPNGIIVSNECGKIVLTNAKAQSLFGYTAEEFVNLEIEDLVPEEKGVTHCKNRSTYYEAPQVGTMGEGRELSAVRKDGTEFPVEIGLVPLAVPGEKLVLSSIIDITIRKRAEQNLHDYASTLEFQSKILNNVHDAVFFVDEEGKIQEWNAAAQRLFGYEVTEIVGHHIDEVFESDSQSLFKKIERKIPREKIVEEVVHCRDQVGKEVLVRATVSRLKREKSSGYLVCASDITERRKLEAELLQVAEEQQRKIGRDIHDDLCSQLSGIGCLTKVLEEQLAEDSRKEAELMKSIGEMVATAGTTARQIAHGLVPSLLQNQGLDDALAELVNTNRKTYGIDIRLSIDDKETVGAIESETAIQIYRIAQEAISNATRHSDAESILVEARVEGGRLELTIQDDGKGMSEDLVSLGLGLTTMRRRAKLLQADFDIHAGPGDGTSIHCSVPLPSR